MTTELSSFVASSTMRRFGIRFFGSASCAPPPPAAAPPVCASLASAATFLSSLEHQTEGGQSRPRTRRVSTQRSGGAGAFGPNGARVPLLRSRARPARSSPPRSDQGPVRQVLDPSAFDCGAFGTRRNANARAARATAGNVHAALVSSVNRLAARRPPERQPAAASGTGARVGAGGSGLPRARARGASRRGRRGGGTVHALVGRRHRRARKGVPAAETAGARTVGGCGRGCGRRGRVAAFRVAQSYSGPASLPAARASLARRPFVIGLMASDGVPGAIAHAPRSLRCVRCAVPWAARGSTERKERCGWVRRR